jgi:hypothetical protein
VDPNQILVAVTSLLAALLGALIAFGAQSWQWRRDRKAQAADAESSAIQRLLVKSHSLDLHAHQLAMAAKYRSSLDGSIFALFGSEGLISTNETMRAMNEDAEDLHAAATHLWLTSDTVTIQLATEVSQAAADIISAHHARRPLPWPIAWLATLIWGVRLGDPEAIEAARVALGTRRELLVQHARARTGASPLGDGERRFG